MARGQRGPEGPIARVEVENHTRVRTKEVLRLLGVREGEELRTGEVERGLGLLARKPEVGDVRVEAEPGAAGLRVRVVVRPRLLVRRVRLVGGPRRVREAAAARLRTAADKPVAWPWLEADRGEIVRVFREEGFPEARVTPVVRPDGRGQWAEVTFRVDPGEPRRVAEVIWPEGFPVEPWRRAALLGIGRGDRASAPELEAGRRRLVTFLRRYGYPEARIEGGGFEPAGPGSVRLVVGIVAGAPVRFRFEGVEEWTKRSLRQALEERYGRPVDEAWLRGAAQALEERLRADGYRDARAVYREERAGAGRVITFVITKGPRVAVKRVRFRGNESVSARKLRPYLSVIQGGILRPPPFTQEALDRDLRVLREYYATKGFWAARIEMAEMDIAADGDAVLTLRVEEGQRFRWGSVTLEVIGADRAGFQPALGRLKPGAWADPGVLEEVRRDLIGRLGAGGFPEGRVVYETRTDPDRGVVDAVFRVEAGPRVRFGKVVVAGNTRTQTKVITRELPIRPGDPWNPAAIREARQRLYRLGFFQRAEVAPVPTLAPPGTRDLEVRVEEQDAGLAEFGLGYGTEEGVKGFLGLSHANLGGYGRSLGGRYDFDRLERSLGLHFREPWLFNHPVDLRLSLIRRTADLDAYSLTSVAFQGSLERRFGPRARGALAYTLEENRLSDVNPEALEAGDPTTSYLLSSVGPFLAWDSRDDPFNPRSGFYHEVQAEWAPAFLGSEVEFERYTGTLSGFWSAGRFTLALLARGGLALTLGRTAELPVNKRFFLGGRGSVRGFERDAIGPRSGDGTPLGGDLMANLRAEVRYRWRKGFGFALFWDAGNVWNRAVEPADFGDLRQGAGAGIRYETPVGPLALDLGMNLDPRDGEPRTVWHFTVGNVF
ncbi:outer membrane protein assembly factor [Deferrisoma palaeochoriense]